MTSSPVIRHVFINVIRARDQARGGIAVGEKSRLRIYRLVTLIIPEVSKRTHDKLRVFLSNGIRILTISTVVAARLRNGIGYR